MEDKINFKVCFVVAVQNQIIFSNTDARSNTTVVGMFSAKICDAYFVSLRTWLNLSKKMSACFSWNISAGRKRIALSPQPPA